MCVRRSDTYSEEMGRSHPSRRIAHGDSGYPVATILDPFLSPRRAASTKANIGPSAVISNVESPRWPGRGRTGSLSRGRDGTPHQPFAGEGPARRRWQHFARNALGSVGCPTFESVGSGLLTQDRPTRRAPAEARCRGRLSVPPAILRHATQ